MHNLGHVVACVGRLAMRLWRERALIALDHAFKPGAPLLRPEDPSRERASRATAPAPAGLDRAQVAENGPDPGRAPGLQFTLSACPDVTSPQIQPGDTSGMVSRWDASNHS
jgi:hypothetical protein